MQIASNSVVTFDYVLKDDDGQLIDASQDGEPLAYLHGVGGIIPGLEKALTGKQVGDELQLSIAPADAYGERDDALRQAVPREQFEGVDDLALGMQFRIETDDAPMVVTVVEINDTAVTIDGNHPLAGMNLNFSVVVRDVREATDEEIAHGHVHGPGGHSH